MPRQELTTRQCSILYVLWLLQRNEEGVTWSALDECFEGATLPLIETIDHALLQLERHKYVALVRAGQCIVAIRLKRKGSEYASVIKLRQVFWRLNVKNIERLRRTA